MRGIVRTAETKRGQSGKTFYVFALEGSEQTYSAFMSVNQGDEIEFNDVINGDFHNAKNLKILSKSKATQAGLEPQKTPNESLRKIALEQAVRSMEAHGSDEDLQMYVAIVLDLANAYFDWLTERDLNEPKAE